MDNLRVHHAERVRVAIESVGAKVKSLPPLSPDLSRKAEGRRQEAEGNTGS